MSSAERELEASLTRNRQMQGMADAAIGGVTVSFLAQVFGMDSNKVKRKLVNCPVKVRRSRGVMQVQHLYDLATAASYLVEPRIDPEDIIKGLRKEDLPPSISTAYWDAQLKRQKWEEQAGQLWRTEVISAVIGSMFQTIKFTIQLWADTLERQTGLAEDQRDLLNSLTDELQKQMFDSLRENAAERMSRPQLAELDEMLIRANRDPKELVKDAVDDGRIVKLNATKRPVSVAVEIDEDDLI